MTRLVLTTEERAQVTAAVVAAEAGTDAEIVTIVTRRSDAYHDVALHYALLAVLAVPGIASLWPTMILPGDGWDAAFGAGLAMLAIVQAVVFLLVRFMLAWAPLRLFLTPRATKARRVRRRAVEYFRVAAEGRTVGREGVLLYLSADEHIAEIVTDHAVHRAVPPECWGDAMATLVDAVRAGRAGAGMVAAVATIGVILARHFPKSAGDRNELADRVIDL